MAEAEKFRQCQKSSANGSVTIIVTVALRTGAVKKRSEIHAPSKIAAKFPTFAFISTGVIKLKHLKQDVQYNNVAQQEADPHG